MTSNEYPVLSNKSTCHVMNFKEITKHLSDFIRERTDDNTHVNSSTSIKRIQRTISNFNRQLQQHYFEPLVHAHASKPIHCKQFDDIFAVIRYQTLKMLAEMTYDEAIRKTSHREHVRVIYNNILRACYNADERTFAFLVTWFVFLLTFDCLGWSPMPFIRLHLEDGVELIGLWLNDTGVLNGFKATDKPVFECDDVTRLLLVFLCEKMIFESKKIRIKYTGEQLDSALMFLKTYDKCSDTCPHTKLDSLANHTECLNFIRTTIRAMMRRYSKHSLAKYDNNLMEIVWGQGNELSWKQIDQTLATILKRKTHPITFVDLSIDDDEPSSSSEYIEPNVGKSKKFDANACVVSVDDCDNNCRVTCCFGAILAVKNTWNVVSGRDEWVDLDQFVRGTYERLNVNNVIQNVRDEITSAFDCEERTNQSPIEATFDETVYHQPIIESIESIDESDNSVSSTSKELNDILKELTRKFITLTNRVDERDKALRADLRKEIRYDRKSIRDLCVQMKRFRVKHKRRSKSIQTAQTKSKSIGIQTEIFAQTTFKCESKSIGIQTDDPKCDVKNHVIKSDAILPQKKRKLSLMCADTSQTDDSDTTHVKRKRKPQRFERALEIDEHIEVISVNPDDEKILDFSAKSQRKRARAIDDICKSLSSSKSDKLEFRTDKTLDRTIEELCDPEMKLTDRLPDRLPGAYDLDEFIQSPYNELDEYCTDIPLVCTFDSDENLATVNLSSTDKRSDKMQDQRVEDQARRRDVLWSAPAQVDAGSSTTVF